MNNILVNYDFDIAAVFIQLFVMFFVYKKKGMARKANRHYMMMIISLIVASVSEITVVSQVPSPGMDEFMWQDILHILYLSAHSALPLAFMMYIIYLIGLDNRLRLRHYILLLLPYAAVLGLIITAPLNRLMFYYDEEMLYVHGPAFFSMYILAALYIGLCFFLLFYYNKKLPKAYFYPVLFAAVFCTIPTIIEYRFPTLLVELFFQSMGLLALMFCIENKEDLISASTHVFNRYVFLQKADACLTFDVTKAMIVVKVANLHYYNSLVGADRMGDILTDVATWLDGYRRGDPCYDCGNGHFALIVPELSKEEEETVKKGIFERFKEPWGSGKHQVVLPICLCYMEVPQDVTTMEDLLLVVDTPFDGTESEEMEEKEIIESYHRKMKVEKMISDALREKRFQVFYQPIWNHDTGTFSSAEALVRLVDEEGKFVPPDEFIPLAEQNGSVSEIGEFVFDEVCQFYQNKNLHALGVEYIEVNLSVIQCMNKKLAQEFDAILKRHELPAGRINLEITESAAYDNRLTLLNNVKALKQTGFQFSLDDFGTGYSNISYMYDMSFDIIKLDKSILWKAVDPKTGKSVENAMIYLENTIRMLQEMKYHILVEGVETKAQKECLEKFGCNYFQGYFFSKPLPGEQYLKFLIENPFSGRRNRGNPFMKIFD